LYKVNAITGKVGGKKGPDGYGGKLLNHLKKITVGLELQNFVTLRAWGKKVGKKNDINMLFLACNAVLCDKSQ
jgi:hypothetical protein